MSESEEEVSEQIRRMKTNEERKSDSQQPPVKARIRVEHVKVPESDKGPQSLEAIKAERDEYLNIVKLEAEKAFQSEKEAVLSQIPESRRDEVESLIGEDPDVLTQVKASLMLRETVEGDEGQTGLKQGPEGKSIIRQAKTGISQDSGNPYHAIVDAAFRKAKLDPNPVEREKGERLVDELFEQYERGQYELGKDNPTTRFSVTSCLSCGRPIFGKAADLYAARKIACPHCGYLGSNQRVIMPKNRPKI